MDKTIANAKHLNAAKGMFFFSRDTMKFWNSRVCTGILKEKYFITSEDNYERTQRLYTVRMIDWETGDIETIGEFQQFKTKEEARERIEQEGK